MRIDGLNDKDSKAIIAVLCKNKFIEKAVLFGSRAKGTEKLNSDIDIVISGVDDAISIEAIAMELDELPMPYKFDVKGISSIKNAALRQHIERVGIVIYKREL